jgi:hypothetical protein
MEDMPKVLMAMVLSIPLYALQPVALGAKVYIHPMDGFGTYPMAALRVKGVPLIVVADRRIADYEILGESESQKAGWAKILILKQTGSHEEASISVVYVRTSEVVFAYNYNTGNSYRGKQSASESCAKHLAEHIRMGGRLASSLPPLPERQAVSRDDPPHAMQVNESPKAIVLRFTSSPGNAEVLVDGEYMGSTPTTEITTAKAGTHTVEIKKRGFIVWARTVALNPGDTRTINAELELAPVDPTKPRIVGIDPQ